MPIPSRPIPTPAPRRAPASTPTTASSAKPGSSLPRRGLTFVDYAEIYDLPLPSSAPVKGLSGVSMVKAKNEVKVKEPRRMEVGVEGLVLEGLGKREKRSTTATSLGFDFIPNPSIVALPDDQPDRPNHKSSLSPSHAQSTFKSPHSPATPALVPTHVGEQEVEDEDDDWEHIGGTDTSTVHDEHDGDEGDMIFLGELELQDHVDMTKGGIKGIRSGRSYAAAAGSTVKA